MRFLNSVQWLTFSDVSTASLAFQAGIWLFYAGVALFFLLRSAESSRGLLGATKQWKTVKNEAEEYKKVRVRYELFFMAALGICSVISIVYAVAFVKRIFGL